MSNVAYDLDTSGGLMPLIRALIKPPDEDINAQKNKKPQHPYYKRPGKGHNHDSCDACGEGGDLICCDRCPASFHLGCYDPPLDENDIPAGLWLCKECRGSDAEAAASASAGGSASARGSRAHSPVDVKPEEKKRSLRNKKKSKDDAKEDDAAPAPAPAEPARAPTAMEVLVRAARLMNPRQFELPREIRVPCLFPGTDKEGCKNSAPSVISVDSSGCVPLPARACYVCQGTCKAAPLLQCDYCPLLYHQDCLDPPLTALPTGRWMCPNHVEQYIDWKLVNSVSATERVALWDKFSGPVDQHAIKVDFIRRARRARPPFRIKVAVATRGRVVVPDMVRYHYANPPPLQPTRREYVRCRNALKNYQASVDYDSEQDDSQPKHAICMNLSCPVYGAGGGGVCPHAEPALSGATDADAAEDLKAIADTKLDRQTDSSDLSDSDFEYLTASVKRRKVSRSEDKSPSKRGGRGRMELRADGSAEALLAAVEDQLDKLDERLVKVLAWQRLQQVLVGEQCYGSWRLAPLSPAAEAAVRRSIDRTRLARFGFRHVALPSELLSRGERDRISRAVWGAPRAASPPVPAGRGSAPSQGSARQAAARLELSDACVKATLCAVERPARNGLGDGLGRPVPMRLSRLTVGSDGSCDVVLDAARCRHVSPRHALIFCDEVTRHFELINYSEWGSRVNGVLYACDVTGGGAPPPPPAAEPDAAPAGAEARAAALWDLVRHRAPQEHRLNGDLAPSLAGSADGCRCGAAPPTAAAWEGSALVPHAALLHFGCLMFVFSITAARAFPYDERHDDPAL